MKGPSRDSEQSEAGTPESDLRAALDRVVFDSLRPVSTGLGFLYVVLAIGHLQVLPEDVAPKLALLASGSACLLFLLRAVLPRCGVSIRWAHPLGFGIAAIVLANSLLHLHLLASPQQTTNLLLLVIGAGSFFLSYRWLALILLLTIVGWLLVLPAASTSSAWVHYGFALFSAGTLSVLIHWVRVRTFRRLESLRLQDERRKLELEKAIGAAQQSEARFRRLSEASLEGVVVHEESRILDANLAVASMLGYEQPELIGMSLLDLLAEDNRDETWRHLLTGYERPYEVTGLRKDRTAVALEICSRAIPHLGNALTVTVLRDLSERKRTEEAQLRAKLAEAANLELEREIGERRRAEQALRDSEERYKQLLGSVTNYVYNLKPADERPLVIAPGQGCIPVTGYTPEEFEANPNLWYEIVSEEDRESVAEHMTRLFSEGKAHVLEHRIVHKDGAVRWVRSTPVPHHDPAGRLVAYDVLVTDITERMRAETALRTASRMEATATLAGGIAHDFNNLMVAVLGNAELLKAEFVRDAPGQTMLDSIIQAAEKAARLAQQLLAYARGAKYQVRVIDLNSIIRSTLNERERLFPSRIEIQLNLAEALWPIQGDAEQMNQVVVSLATNAVEAIQDSGRVVITTQNLEIDEAFARLRPGLVAGRYACLSVEDTGCGMTAAVRSRIFEPFFTTRFQGRGLGLAATYGIVKNHGGYISVESEEGRGATFRVYLPADLSSRR